MELSDEYISLIIDGMSSDKCHLPYKANLVQSSTTVKQKIMGAKQHGFRRSLHRFMPHVPTSSNMACDVVMEEIIARQEDCIANNKPFPHTLSVQIDGGSDNAALDFYAFCELLVRLDVFESVEVNRLPVGHTHEDIDAMFGTLWKALQRKTIVTPQEWQAYALAAFNVE